MRILNSSSLDSIMGIKTLNNIIFRPLIDISKYEINSYAKKNKIAYGIDPTNNDISLTRNFLRKKIIPLLETIKPNLAIPFKDLENKIDDVKDVIDFSINQFMNSEYINIEKGIVYIDKNYFLGLPFLMQINILRMITSEKKKFYFSKNLLKEFRAFLRKNVIGSTKLVNNYIINIDREFIILRMNKVNNNVYRGQPFYKSDTHPSNYYVQNWIMQWKKLFRWYHHIKFYKVNRRNLLNIKIPEWEDCKNLEYISYERMETQTRSLP